MLGNLQSPSGEEEFMAFSCTELNRALLDYARTHLNETEETKRKALQELDEYVRKEFNVHMENPDSLYLCVLRARKFDVKRTCSLVKRFVDFGRSHKYLFDRSDSEAVRKTVHSKVVGFLPHRDAKGRAILYLRAECWNPSELKADDLIFGSVVSLQVAAENPVNQVAGFVVIVNFKNLTAQHVIGMSSWLLFGVQALQRCCPCQVKAIHVLHTSAIFRATWKIVKPIVGEKIRKRIIFYKSSNSKRLHQRISPRILPEELGGQLGPYSFEHWASDIPEMEKQYRQRCDHLFEHARE